MKELRYRWAAPDGRKGRWRKSTTAAIIAAVGTRSSDRAGGLTVSFDAASAEALWPTLKADGWVIEYCKVSPLVARRKCKRLPAEKEGTA